MIGSIEDQLKYGEKMELNGWTVEFSQSPIFMGENYKWTSPDGETFQSFFSDCPPALAIQKYIRENENTNQTHTESCPKENSTEEEKPK